MNDSFNTRDLAALIAYEGRPAVSIYMPAHRISSRTPEDSIRLRNLLRAAEEQVAALGVRTPDIRSLLAPAQAKVDDMNFWLHQSDGLAIFLGPGDAYFFRLPVSFPELVVAGDGFHVKPLLPLLANDGNFYVLAVSQNHVRVLRGAKQSIDALDLESVPASLAEALAMEDGDRSEEFQFHTPAVPAMRGIAGRGVAYNSGGALEDDDKDRILRFFRAIDKGLQSLLRDQQAPLVFAGVDYLLPIYREANTYAHLMEEAITGNPEALRPEELHAAAWEVVAPHFARAQSRSLETLAQMLATNQAATDIEELLPAAYQGRVALAFVPLDQQVWGRFDPEQMQVEVTPNAEGSTTLAGQAATGQDLYDQLAVYTLLRDGQVFVLPQDQLPGGAQVAAVYRY